MAEAEIILPNGASSAGKSTLARELQQRLESPFLYLSFDLLRDGGAIPLERFRRGDFDWAESRAAVFAGLHNSIAAFAGAGNDLIVEHIIEQRAWLEDLLRLLAPFDVYCVGVHSARWPNWNAASNGAGTAGRAKRGETLIRSIDTRNTISRSTRRGTTRRACSRPGGPGPGPARSSAWRNTAAATGRRMGR